MIIINRIFLNGILFLSIIMGLFLTAKCSSAKTDNQITIIITDPKDWDVVPMERVVRETVSDATLQVYVLVHLLATNLWWVQRIPNVQSNGR